MIMVGGSGLLEVMSKKSYHADRDLLMSGAFDIGLCMKAIVN